MDQKILERIQTYIVGGLLIFFAYMVFNNLGGTPLENWDEGFYAENAKQMMRTGDWWVLHYNEKLFLEKPPLQIWMTVGLANIFGLTELIIRLPSAVFAFITVAIITLFSYRRFGFIAALFAFASLAFNNIYMWRARSGNFDSLTALLFVIIFFLMLSRWKYRYLFLGISFGLLYMTKLGVVVFPLFIFGVYELITYKHLIYKNILGYIILAFSASVLPLGWLYMGYQQIGQAFLNSYVFNISQGVSEGASLSKFNTDYMWYSYYSLQRRFSWFLVAGLAALIVSIRKSFNFNVALLLFSVVILIQLSFIERKNNWYLVPMMPFWSLTIAYGVRWILDTIEKFKIRQLNFAAGLLLILFCLLIGLKTYRVNITPIFTNKTNLVEQQTALKFKELAGKDDVVIRLDHSYPVTIYYSDHFVEPLPFLPRETLEKYMSNDQKVWAGGKKSDVQEFIKRFPSIDNRIIPVNNEEDIVEFIK